MTYQRVEDEQGARLVAGLTGDAMSLPPDLILARGRGSHEVCRARQVAMYLAHVGFGMSLARVAIAFGRDRSTVAHGCHLIEDRRDDPGFDAFMDQLEDGLRAVSSVREAA